jgi:glycerophosphoryl diester phosphodiesterase
MKLQDLTFFLTGHRGCRGLYPENSIPGFIQTLQFPVNTIELDVVISADEQVVVSHEPWLHEDFCLNEKGQSISPEEAHAYNLFRMPYSQIAKYDCGSNGHKRFPDQKKMMVRKPLLEEVIRVVESTGKKIIWDIELKSVPEEYRTFQPAPDRFCEIGNFRNKEV